MKGGASGTWSDYKGNWEQKIPTLALLAVRISVCQGRTQGRRLKWCLGKVRTETVFTTQREKRRYIQEASKCITISKDGGKSCKMNFPLPTVYLSLEMSFKC